MYTENANRAASDNPFTPNDFEPNPKNPLIAAFFRNIGLADELGSGVRKLFKYAKRYSGKEPELIDGDVFRTVVPLDDDYSFDGEDDEFKTPNKTPFKTPRTDSEVLILKYIAKNPKISQKSLIEISGLSKRTVQESFKNLQTEGIIFRDGAKKNGAWVIKE
ncbi:MAG: winged helix-turn-helix transcriptional regulator [Ruminococcus sp.]|jgi:ATP-dependent DNA helicase RecG|nr:winged helix-turn-helix transcriptional regulator [Ruminococcus sp.]